MRRESTDTPDSATKTAAAGPTARGTTPAYKVDSPQRGSGHNSGGRVPPAAWLTAVHFDVPYPAEATALQVVRTALAITDPADNGVTAAALVTWDHDDRRPRLQPLAIPGSLDRGLMELIFAITFMTPLIAAATHCPPHDQRPPLDLIGIDSLFVNRLRDHLSPGTWMILMFATPEQLDAASFHTSAGVISNRTLLTSAQVAALQAVYGTAPGE